MSVGKQKLRPWLEEMISKGEVNGLCWLNDEKNKFRIPWKHGGKQDWSPDSGQIFKEWAKHTGKYREGVDETNYPTWKTRLRCAFNKAPDIQEVKAESQLNCSEPFRVYILTQAKRCRPSSKTYDKKGQRSSCKEEEDEEEEEEEGGGGGQTRGTKRERAIEDETYRPDSLVPTMVADYDCSSPTEECISPSFAGLSPTELLSSDSDSFLQLFKDINCQLDGTFPSDELTGEPAAIMNDVPEMGAYGGIYRQPLKMNKSIHFSHPHTKDYFIKLEIFYCGKQVCERECDIRTGLRLAVTGCPTNVWSGDAAANFPSIVRHLLSNNPQMIYFPSCGGLLDSPQYEQMVDYLLTKCLVQGLLLWMNEDGDIFAYRLCQGAIYYNSKAETDGKPVKIPLSKDKHEFVKIFSCRDCFTGETDDIADSSTSVVLDSTVYLCCGQALEIRDIPEKVFVSVKITLPAHQGSDESRPSRVAEEEPDDFYNMTSSVGTISSSVLYDMDTDIESHTTDEITRCLDSKDGDDDDDDDDDDDTFGQ